MTVPYRVLFSNDTTNILTCKSPYNERGCMGIDPQTGKQIFRSCSFDASKLEATVDETAGRGIDVHMLQPGMGWVPWWQSRHYPYAEHVRFMKEHTGMDPAVDPYSDRDNRVNLFGVDLESGALTQLTDWDPAKVTNRHSLSKNPVREEIGFYYDNAVQVLDLATLTTRRLLECPKGYTGNLADFTADGKHLVTGFCQDLSDRFQVDLLNGYIGFNEMWAAKPHSTIWKIPLAGGEPQLIHEDRSWLGHFNASPKLPNIMTFCHEGPWDKVDNRIWGLDIETGRTWKIRPTVPGECVGHEYWMSDGEHIGYHGGNQKGGLYGSIRYDNTDLVEAPFSGHCWHFHSYMLDLVIGDGNAQEPYLLAWRFRDGVFEGPKVLAWHRGSFHSQQLHVHPCVHTNGTKVLYTADPQAYGQVYIVDVPAWDALPDRAAVTKNKEV